MEAERQSAPRFSQYRSLLAIVLQGIERLHRALSLSGTPETHPGWRELKGRPFAGADDQQKPWLVATLFGPTGSGKSTIFRLLTGLNVPAGDVLRPVTFSPLVAVPESLNDPAVVQDSFPFNSVSQLDDLELLKKQDMPRETLFFATYNRSHSDCPLDFILADVPDFDTVYRQNWEKAEDMMRRAEVVLFTLYPAAYMDQAVLRNLQTCCRHAGSLALLFNKMESREQAELIWRDLLDKTESAGELKDFQQHRRQDGRPLAEFLRDCAAYWSPRSSALTLNQIEPLAPQTPPLTDLLTGLDGVAVLLASLREDTRKGIDSCRGLCLSADAQAADLEKKIALAEAHIRHAASIVSGTCFPAGQMTALILEVAREYRPIWVKMIGAPAAFFSTTLHRSRETLKRVFRDKVKPMSELEQDRLRQVVDDLLRALRADLPDAGLTMERCQQLRLQLFQKEPWPVPSEAWSQAVRESTIRWARENRWKTTVLGSANDVLIFLGGAAVGVDLLVTGGQSTLWGSFLLGKLGIVGAAGAGGAAAGALLNFFEKLGLRRTLELADQMWRRQRSEEIAQFLQRHLVGPVFLERWQALLSELRQLPLDRYRSACDRLEQFLENAHSRPDDHQPRS